MKKIFYYLLVIIIILGGVVAYFFLSKNRPYSEEFKLNFDNPEEIFNIETPAGFSESQIERLEEKKATAKELYETKKDDTWTWIVIGNIYKFVEDYDRAIASYEHVLSIQPLEVISLQNLATIYEKYKIDYEKSEYYYQHLLDANSSVPTYYINFAQFYDNRIKDTKKAESVFLNGLEKTNNNPDLLVALIRFYEKHEDLEKAREYAQNLINSNPDNEIYKQDFQYLIDKE